jgi:hypothetical protein
MDNRRESENFKTDPRMTSRQEEIKALRAGETLPSHRVVQLRSMGMHAVRFEFVVRLLRSGLKVDTLSIYWERGTEFMLKQEVESVPRRLVLGRRQRVYGEFSDLALLCYPDDEEVRKTIEQELDAMVEKLRRQDIE